MSIPNYRLSATNFIIHDKMSLPMDCDFSEWLTSQLNKKSWSQSELANKAGLNRQVISTYINRQRNKPDADVLIAIGKAFGIPPEEVFRAAGLLPPERKNDSRDNELVYLFKLLPDGEKEQVLDYVRYVVEKTRIDKK